MATFTVTTAADVIDANDGFISLREAIAMADGAAGADTINFDAALAGSTITLSHDAGMKALTLSTDVTIDGDTNGDNKADITIDADRDAAGMAQADFHSVLEITGGNVKLDSLTITGGRALVGGGIDIAAGAVVTVDHSTITGNYVSGQETNSSVAGAGIANAGTLTVTNSAIHDNGAGAGTGGDATGGGIYNTGTLTVENTTLATNFAEGGDGESFLGNVITPAGKALGAGIGNNGGTVDLYNVTMTGNVAQYDPGSAGGLPGVPGSGTVTSFGGLYSSGGTSQVVDSILLGNVAETSSGTSNAADASSGITYKGLNIVGIGTDADASDSVIQAKLAGLVFETAVNGGQSLLVAGQLADNGGAVKTVKLNDDRYNPALDASDADGSSFDALGTAAYDDANIANRDSNARDLGAFELGTDTPPNAAPTMSGDLAGSMNEGATLYITRNDLYATDVDILDDEQNLSFTVSGQTNGVVKLNGTATTTFTAYEVRTGQVSFVHNGGETTTAGFDVVVDDGNEDGSDPVESRFNIAVAKVNDLPTINKLIADVKPPIHTDLTFSVANNFKDNDHTLSFTAKQGNGSVLPTWLKFYKGVFTMTPPDTVSGEFTIVVTAKDGAGATKADTFKIVIPKKPGLTAGADNGADSITKGSTSDTINAGNGTNTVNSGAGNDKVYTGTGTDKVDLGTGDDRADLGDGNDSGKGEDGYDSLYGGGGDDTLYGGNGSDYLDGQVGNDKLYGDAGNDRLYGGNGADTLRGGTGDDYLYGDGFGSFADTLYGDAGNDYLAGGNGADTLRGGTGDDYLYGDDFGSFADTLYGDAGNDRLYGGNGADTLRGGTEDDRLNGDGGNDTLYGDAGVDTMYGGAGDDTYSVDNLGDRAIESANGGTDLVKSAISFALGANVENLLLTGTASSNGTGNDLGNVITGNSGLNTLDGGAGDDALTGGAGNDTLTGGAGIDTFKFAIANVGVDTITDFEVGVDKIGLAISAGSDLVAFGAEQDANDFLIYDSATGALYYDADADGLGVALQFATLSNLAAITINDFVFA